MTIEYIGATSVAENLSCNTDFEYNRFSHYHQLTSMMEMSGIKPVTPGLGKGTRLPPSLDSAGSKILLGNVSRLSIPLRPKSDL